MNKKRTLVFTLLLVLTCDLLLAKPAVITNREPYQLQDKNLKEVQEYLKKRELELNQLAEREKQESPMRRFEVMFFSSGAMVYWSSFIFVKLFAEIVVGHSSEMNNTYWYYIGFNAVGIATYVSLKDYYDRKAQKEKDKNKYGNLNQKDYTLNLFQVRF